MSGLGCYSLAFLMTLLAQIVHRGSLGFGEEALQSLPGRIGCQAPDRFVVAAARNPVCNLSLMVGTTDIPDWCYTEACGKEGKNFFSEAPSAEQLSIFYKKSPISHILKVKVPILFLLGAQDLRVPMSNGLQMVTRPPRRPVSDSWPIDVVDPTREASRAQVWGRQRSYDRPDAGKADTLTCRRMPYRKDDGHGGSVR
ncbi:hypothetical protein BHM03_00047816 [Ensete ventricosum]|nr:hypothetical protein BHM03_00047816 [Ensete ventricosum]